MAPTKPPITGRKTIFLAGSTNNLSDEPNWRETLTERVSHLPVTVLNPNRPDWDSTWREDVSDERFRRQVEWELEMQERADLLVVYFQEGTDAPVSLLEFGLRARVGGNAVVAACQPGYKKRGNVEIVCQRYGLMFVESGEALGEEVLRWLSERMGEEKKSASMPPSVD
jgi:hypothetical protein